MEVAEYGVRATICELAPRTSLKETLEFARAFPDAMRKDHWAVIPSVSSKRCGPMDAENRVWMFRFVVGGEPVSYDAVDPFIRGLALRTIEFAVRMTFKRLVALFGELKDLRLEYSEGKLTITDTASGAFASAVLTVYKEQLEN